MSLALVDKYTKEELEQLVKDSSNMKELILKLGYTAPSGNNNITVKNRLDKYQIDYSHFVSRLDSQVKRSEENIFIENSTASQSTVRRWYKKGNYTPYECAICGQQPFWQGKDLVMILDHINGHNHDDRLENLRWVCPNCNQQLETTGFKQMRVQEKNCQPKKVCPDCGKEIWSNSTYCALCAPKHRRTVERPDRETLKQLIRSTPFTHIATQFGVTDNTIRKWCKAVNLPSKVVEINNYSDEEWELI